MLRDNVYRCELSHASLQDTVCVAHVWCVCGTCMVCVWVHVWCVWMQVCVKTSIQDNEHNKISVAVNGKNYLLVCVTGLFYRFILQVCFVDTLCNHVKRIR